MVARAWTDPPFRERLLADGTEAIAEFGFGGPEGQMIVAVENTPAVHNVVVCTLCSCYPWPVLGLPPAWYKSAEYRSRMVAEPRKVLGEMGLEVPDEVRIRVWDSSAEARYLVLPERPEGTDDLDAEELAALVTRDAMIGVGRPLAPSRRRCLSRPRSTPTSRARSRRRATTARSSSRRRGSAERSGSRSRSAAPARCEWETFRQALIARIGEDGDRPYWRAGRRRSRTCSPGRRSSPGDEVDVRHREFAARPHGHDHQH